MPALNERRISPLPDASEPVVDRHRRFTPSWFRFIRPLLEATRDQKTVLEAVSGTTDANTAAITTEATVRAAADTAIASQVSTLSTTVAGNTTSIQTLATSVDGIEASYAVTINQNGRVIGYQRLDGLVTGSVFSVLADKFVIYNPSNDGQSVQAFTVGSVNGTTTVGITGTAIIDGTIIARHIAAGVIDATKIKVDNLSAVSANAGTITAGVLQSSDGKVVFDLNAKTLVMTT